jgi:hypothetical protein
MFADDDGDEMGRTISNDSTSVLLNSGQHGHWKGDASRLSTDPSASSLPSVILDFSPKPNSRLRRPLEERTSFLLFPFKKQQSNHVSGEFAFVSLVLSLYH